MKLREAAAVCLLLALAPASLPAATLPRNAGSGSCELKIQIDTRDTSLHGARIVVQHSNGSHHGDRILDSRGEAEFRVRAPGSYRITAISPNLGTRVVEVVELQPGERLRHVFLGERPARKAASSTAKERPTVGALDLQAPENARREAERGQAALERSDWKEAHRRFSRAVQLHPPFPSAQNNLGVAAMHLGKREEGRRAFERALQLDPRLPRAHLNLARLLVAQADYAEATEVLAAAPPPQVAEIFTLLALCQLATGKPREAVASAKKAHAAMGEHPMAHFVAGRALEGLQLQEEAAAEYRRFLEEAPLHPSAAHAQAALAALVARN